MDLGKKLRLIGKGLLLTFLILIIYIFVDTINGDREKGSVNNIKEIPYVSEYLVYLDLNITGDIRYSYYYNPFRDSANMVITGIADQREIEKLYNNEEKKGWLPIFPENNNEDWENDYKGTLSAWGEKVEDFPFGFTTDYINASTITEHNKRHIKASISFRKEDSRFTAFIYSSPLEKL